MPTGHHQTLLDRYDVLDWDGEGCVVYDRSQFLTHLLDDRASALLRAGLAQGQAKDSHASLRALFEELLTPSPIR